MILYWIWSDRLRISWKERLYYRTPCFSGKLRNQTSCLGIQSFRCVQALYWSPGSLFLTCATFEPYHWTKWFTVVSDAFLWQFGESRFSNKYRQKMIWLLNKNVQNCHFSILFIYQIHRNNLLSSESLIKYLINIGSFNKE